MFVLIFHHNLCEECNYFIVLFNFGTPRSLRLGLFHSGLKLRAGGAFPNVAVVLSEVDVLGLKISINDPQKVSRFLFHNGDENYSMWR